MKYWIVTGLIAVGCLALGAAGTSMALGKGPLLHRTMSLFTLLDRPPAPPGDRPAPPPGKDAPPPPRPGGADAPPPPPPPAPEVPRDPQTAAKDVIQQVGDRRDRADGEAKGAGKTFLDAAPKALDQAKQAQKDGDFIKAVQLAWAADAWSHAAEHLQHADEPAPPDRPRPPSQD